MSNESSDIDILYEGPKSVCPGTLVFLRQQVHLLENLQRRYKHLPTHYKGFLNCVNSLETIYEPAVILGAWKVLLDKHLLHIREETENCTTTKNVKQNITNKLMLSTNFEKTVPHQTIDSVNSNNNNGVSLKKGKKNSNPKKIIVTANKIEKKIENEDHINYYSLGSKLKKIPRKNSGSIEDTNEKKLKICNRKSKNGQSIQIPISRDETSNNSINVLSKPELSIFLIDGNSCIKEKKNVEYKMSNNETANNSVNILSKKPELSCFLMDDHSSFKDNNNLQSKTLGLEICNNVIITAGNSKPEETDFSKDKKSFLKVNIPRNKMPDNSTYVRTQLEHNYALNTEKEKYKRRKKSLLNIPQNITPSVKPEYQTINLITTCKKRKNNREDQSDINIDNVAKEKEADFDNSPLFRHTKYIVRKDESIALKPISCTKVKIKAENDITHTIQKKKTGSKRKKKECFENANSNECSSSSRRKKKHKSKFSLEDFSATILGNFMGEKKTKKKIRNMDESELKKYGLTKSELIQFCKEQKKERAAEKKKLETQMLEMFHDRLVDVIIPKYFSFNDSN